MASTDAVAQLSPEFSVGAIIAACRRARNLSRRQLSFALGRSESYVSKIEAGLIADMGLVAFARAVVALRLTALEVHVLLTRVANGPPVDVTPDEDNGLPT